MSKIQLPPEVSSTLTEIPLDDDDDNEGTPSDARVTTPCQSSVPTEHIRIVLVGEANVGKTEFANCVKTRTFSGTTVATIGMGFTSVDMILCAERRHTRVDLYDTAGQERHGGHLMRTYYRLANGVIFVVDLTSPASWVRAQNLYAEITEDVPDAVCLFVANKSDLFDDHPSKLLEAIEKLTMLFAPGPPKPGEPPRPPRRRPSDIYRPEELEMPLKAISLRRTAPIALDLVAELAQRIIINRAEAIKRASISLMTPRSGETLGSSKLIAAQQRAQLEQLHKQKQARGTLRLRRQAEYNSKEQERKKTLGSGGWCFV